MTDTTIISVTSGQNTYSITVPADLTCTEFIRYCAHLAKAQGYMLPSIADALEAAHVDTLEEIQLRGACRCSCR